MYLYTLSHKYMHVQTDDLIFNPPQLLPRSPSRRPSVRRSSLIDNSEPLTWINLSAHVALAIHQLTTAVKANQFQQWSQLASAVVSAVRFMLMTSNTLDKDSSYIKSHGPLKTHHRALMATLSKLVLTSHTHASEQDSEKILAESSELLMAVRRFVSTCQDLALPLYHTDIRWVETQENNKLLESNGNKSARYTLQMNLAENLETMGNCIQDSAETIIKCIAACQAQYSDRASLASLLFTHFRNLANQTGLFIGYLDDTDFSQVQSGDMAELQLGKQALVDGLGQLFYKLQTMTDEKCDLTRVLDQIEDGAAGLFEPIELICANILRLARKGRSRSSSVASYHTVEMSIPALPIAIENSTIHEDDEEEDILSIVDGTEFSSKDNTTFNGTYFTDHLDQDDILSLKIGQEPGSPPRPSDLMERHHSDVTPTASVSDDIAASPPPMIRSYTSPTKAQSSKLKKFFGDDAPIPEAVAAAAKPVENEKPWFLEYDYGTQEIVFNMEGHVKGGTLPALVERLTLHDYLDMNFINTFLLTYRSFCSTTNLMDLLEARYNLPCPNGLTKGDIGVWEEKKLKLVRLRVFNVLKNWLELYYNDDDSALLDRLLDFINTNIKTTLKFSNGQLESLIEERRTNTMDSSSGLKKMILTLPDPPEPILPRNRKRFKLLDIDALELARQLTIMDFKLYSSIRPIECLDKAWSSPDDQIAHNIRSSIEYCNQVTSWVSDVILSQHDIKKRSIYIKFWVQVAEVSHDVYIYMTAQSLFIFLFIIYIRYTKIYRDVELLIISTHVWPFYPHLTTVPLAA
jgi:hypothetical protein